MGKTMIEKRGIDAHLENFNFEQMTFRKHDEWIEQLQILLKKYRNARGR